MTLSYSLHEVEPYINWLYFYHAWGLSGKPEKERQQLRSEADERLTRYGHKYKTHAVFQLFPAHSDGDDIVIGVSREGRENSAEWKVKREEMREVRIPCLRQQQAGSDFLCLSDFIAPKAPPTSITHHPSPTSQIGLFSTTVDSGMENDFDSDPYEKMMMQLLGDRLAEATAECLHEAVRKNYWGYAKDEQLTISDMLIERWQGIRPAVGYPSLPDTSINFLIEQLIGMSQIGIRLTESGAMKPHASVSGLMLANPAARYFNVGKIGRDQLADYASRRGMSTSETRKFLQANL